LLSAPQQSAMLSGPESEGILGQAQHSSGSPPALLTTLDTLSLFPLPQAEDHPEGKMVQDAMEIQLNTYDSCTEKLKNCCYHDVQLDRSYSEEKSELTVSGLVFLQ
jgi:hypothetical protein